MDTPLQISFHNLPHSQVIETAIREAAARLEASYERIVSCRVIVDQPHKHHKEGNPYQVRIDLKVPGAELVVKREPAGGGEVRARSMKIASPGQVPQDLAQPLQGSGRLRPTSQFRRAVSHAVRRPGR